MAPRHFQYEAIVRAAKSGETPKEIAARLDLKRSIVYGILKNERGNGEDIPSFKGNHGRPVGTMTVTLSLEQINQIKPAATRYRMHPRELAKMVLATVIADNLYEAVLDLDEDDPPPIPA
ncbi:MAG: helix-turn-helix domain-containing protein [Octadecabacter sp.]